jgi:broad specificity phosphatase PhoE
VKMVYFISHPEVVIDPAVPIPRWPLSARGIARMQALLHQPWIADITSVACSMEQKAIDGAAVVAARLSLPVRRVAALGEHDRSSTGYLPPEEFSEAVDEFFARPEASVRGWEPAAAAQRRIVGTVRELVSADASSGALALVSHGGVGTLLLCHLAGVPIARAHDQPGSGGGHYFAFAGKTGRLLHGWRPIDEVEDGSESGPAIGRL